MGTAAACSLPTEPSPSLERQAVSNVLEDYRRAFLHEDIDLLQTLLEPEGVLAQGRTAARQHVQRQEEAGTLTDAQTFRDARSADFRDFTVTDLQILPETVQMAADRKRSRGKLI